MNFVIPCETFARLAHIPSSLKPTYTNQNYKCLMIDVSSTGEFLLAVTNVKIMAVEKIGQSEFVNMQIPILFDESLVTQCGIETAFNGDVHLTFNDSSKVLTAITTYGYVCQTNLYINPNQIPEFASWRDKIPKNLPSKPFGNIYTHLDDLRVMAQSAPSGSVVFQDVIDMKLPILVNDLSSPNWLGVFHPGPPEDAPDFQKPKWIAP